MGMERSEDGDRLFSLLKLSDLGSLADDDRRDDGFVETVVSNGLSVGVGVAVALSGSCCRRAPRGGK